MNLQDARVLCIGAGGLGSPVALYLGAAGVGTLGLIDADVVELSNLQRQLLHRTDDVGRRKVLSGRDTLLRRHPSLTVRLHDERLEPHNALALLRDYDAVVDGSDNFRTKFLANDAAVLCGVPLVHGGILRFFGQLLTIRPRLTACYRCLFEAPPPAGEVPSCAEAGVIGAMAGVVGALMAQETVRLLTSPDATSGGRLITYDALEARFREVPIRRNPRCAVCGDAPTIRALAEENYLSGECSTAGR